MANTFSTPWNSDASFSSCDRRFTYVSKASRRAPGRELDVRAVMLVGEDLADVVQQRAPLREGDVQLQLGGHHSGEPGDLLGVLQDVLAVRGAVLHAPDELHQLGIHAADTDVVDGL